MTQGELCLLLVRPLSALLVILCMCASLYGRMSNTYQLDFYLVKSAVHYPIDSSKSELLRQLKDTKADRVQFAIDFKNYDGDVGYSRDFSDDGKKKIAENNDVDEEEENVTEDKDENDVHNSDDEEYDNKSNETCPYISLLLLSTKGDELKMLKLMTTNVSFMVALNMGTESSETTLRIERQASKLKDVLEHYLKTTTPLSSKWEGLVSFGNTGVVVSVAKDMPLDTLLMFPHSSIHSGFKSIIYKFTVSMVTCVKMYKRIFDFLRDNSSIVKNKLSPTTINTSFEWCLLILSGNHRHLNDGGSSEDWLNSDFISDSLILEGSVGSRNLKEYKEFCGTIKHGIVYRRRCFGQAFQIDITTERFNKTDFIGRFVNRPQAVPSGDDDGGMVRQPEFICTFAKLFAIRIGKIECLAISFTTISHTETIAFHLPSLDRSLLKSKIPSSEEWKFVELKITEKIERDIRDERHRIEAAAAVWETMIENIDDNPVISRQYEIFLFDSFIKHVSNICSKRHLFTDFCIHDGLDEKLIIITGSSSSSSKEGILTLSSPTGIVSQLIKRTLISANFIDCIERVFDKYDNSLMFSGKRFNRHLRFLKKDDVRRFDNFSPAGTIHGSSFSEVQTAFPSLHHRRQRKEIDLNVEREFVTCALEHGIYFPVDRFAFQNRGVFFGNIMENNITAAAFENESHSALYERAISTRAAPLRDNVFQYLLDSSLTNNFKYMRQFTPYVYDDNKNGTVDQQVIEVDCCFDDSPPCFIPWTIARILQMSFENVCIVESKYLLEEFGETTHQKFASLCNLIDNHWVFKYDVDFIENCYKDNDNLDTGDSGTGRNQNLLRTLLVTSIEDLRKTSRVIVIFIYFDSEGNFSDDDLSVKCYLNAYSHKSNDLFSYIRRVAHCGEGGCMTPAINSQYFIYNTAVSYIVDAFLQSISNRLTNMSICHTFWQNHAFYVQRPHLKSNVITIAKGIVEEMDARKMREYKVGNYRDCTMSTPAPQPPWRSFLYKSEDILSSIKCEPTLEGKLIASNKKGYIVSYEVIGEARRRQTRRSVHPSSTMSAGPAPNHETHRGSGGSSNTAIQLKYVFFSSIGTIQDYKEFWGNKKIIGGNCNNDGYNILTTGKIILDSIVYNCHLFKCEDNGYTSLLARLLPELLPLHFSIQASLNAEEYAAFKVDSVKSQQTTGGDDEDTRFAILQRDIIGACYQNPDLSYVAGDKLSLIPVIKTTTSNTALSPVFPIISTDFDPRYYRVERDYALDKYLKFSLVLTDILTTFFPEQAAIILQNAITSNDGGKKEEVGLSSNLSDIYFGIKYRLHNFHLSQLR